MEVNIHQSKTGLSKLIAAAEAGEEVIIARNGKPAVELVSASPKLHHVSGWAYINKMSSLRPLLARSQEVGGRKLLPLHLSTGPY